MIPNGAPDEPLGPSLQFAKRGNDAAPSIDVAQLPRFRGCLAHHGVSIELNGAGNARNFSWMLTHRKTNTSLGCSFDADIERVLTRLAAGESFPQIAAMTFAASTVAHHFDPLTGGPFCVVCAMPGGLPCPAMVRQAQTTGIKLAYPEGDARLVPNHVHPGKCRANLRKWLDTAAQHKPKA